MQEAARLAAGGRAILWFEPVSTAKAGRACDVMHLLDFVSPNAEELKAMAASVLARRKEMRVVADLKSVNMPAEVACQLPNAVSLVQVLQLCI